MNFNAKNLLLLLNKPSTDAEVQALLNAIKLQTAKLRIKRGESDVAIESKEFGIVLNFKHAGDALNFPEGTLILSTIHAMSKGTEGHQQFDGALVSDLSFDMKREDVKRILGNPDWSSPMLAIDRWERPGYQIVVQFHEDRKPATIYSVVVQLPHGK
jgi:hypothetical protein